MIDLKTYLEAKTTTISNLLLLYYKKIGLSDTELVMYLQLSRFEQQGNDFPQIIDIAKVMGLSEEASFQVIQQLLEKRIIEIVTLKNKLGQTEDKYNLDLVFEKISHVIDQENIQIKDATNQDKKTTLFYQFEEEFSRPLSPIELETVQAWLDEDNYSVELISLALKEAVLNQAYSLKYIDRILLSWEKKNFKTSRDVQMDQKKRLDQIDNQYNQESTKEVLPKIPMFDWLNTDEG